MGWAPPATSMIARRRKPSPTGPSAHSPSPSGPRWRRTSRMIFRRVSSTGSSGFRPTMPAIPHMVSVSSDGPLAEGHARDLFARRLLFGEPPQEEAIEREVRREHRVPRQARQAATEDRVLDRDAALAPEAHVDYVEALMTEQALLHRRAVVGPLVEHAAVVARLDPVGIRVRGMELLEIALVAPRHREADEPAGLEHAGGLPHGRDVAVAGNVLDDGDREDPVEGAVLVGEPLRVLRLHQIALAVPTEHAGGVGVIRRKEVVDEIGRPHAGADPRGQEQRQELRAADVEDPVVRGDLQMLEHVPELRAADVLDRQDQALERVARGDREGARTDPEAEPIDVPVRELLEGLDAHDPSPRSAGAAGATMRST